MLKRTKNMILDLEYLNSMQEIMKDIQGFEIIKNGEITQIDSSHSLFQNIYNNVENLIQNSRLEPAFGVSLHNQTLDEIENNEFLKIKFNKQLIINDLPFECLLIKLDEECYGTNIIRENNSNYFGRCFYLFFNEMQNLKDLIKTD